MGILQPSDIIDIGIEKEKKRRDFYALAAGRFKDNADLASLFGRLRDWEEEHIEKFGKIRESVKSAHYAESFPGEAEVYMQALVDSELYDEMTPYRFAEMVDSPGTALDLGIRFEKDAILFFSELSRFADPKTKEVTAKLIREEQEHMVHLMKMKKEMGL
jgi:rubrerythrin